MAPPKPPSSTNQDANEPADATTSDSTGGDPRKPRASSSKTPLLDELDQLNAEQLADYFYALAEEIISNPQEYKLKMGLEQLDISEFDNIDLSTPAGRRKLAALFRLLATQVLKGKAVYQSSVVDKSKPQTRGR